MTLSVMTNIANTFLRFEPIIKNPIIVNYAFFAVVTFSQISFLAYINSIVNAVFVISIYQKPILVSFKTIFTKLIYHLLVYNFRSTII